MKGIAMPRNDGAVLIGSPVKVSRVEICRSFSYRLNVGNYESRDFFASQKSECAIEDAGDVSTALYQFCKSQVLQSVREYQADIERQRPHIERSTSCR